MQRKESDSTAETSVHPALTVSGCAKVPSALGRPDTIDIKPAEGPVSTGEEQEAPVFVVDTLPPGGIAQLIRTYTKELNAFGAIVLRASPSLRPGDCPMPASSKLATLKQLYPMMPTTVSTRSQPKDSGGILPKVETLLPILQSEDLSIKDFNSSGAACATRLRALYLGADEAKFAEGMTDASVFWKWRTRGRKRFSKLELSGPSQAQPTVVRYMIDVMPTDDDGLNRSPGDPECQAVCSSASTCARLDSPLTINRAGMAQHLSTYDGVNTNMLYKGSMWSMFPWHAEDWDLPSISYLQEGEAKIWSVVPLEQREDFEAFTNAHLNSMVLRAAN